AAQNLGLPPSPESAVSLFIAMLVVIGPYNVLRPQSVYLFSIALGKRRPKLVVQRWHIGTRRNHRSMLQVFFIALKAHSGIHQLVCAFRLKLPTNT
ncbi:hypothetical protein, partial [Noviherbaspirillum soli]|uniref:hypothetical protein n=1 Tax=Noviherbaspirillum soli TaxID=1064518 RepID=UPI001E3CAD9A